MGPCSPCNRLLGLQKTVNKANNNARLEIAYKKADEKSIDFCAEIIVIRALSKSVVNSPTTIPF